MISETRITKEVTFLLFTRAPQSIIRELLLCIPADVTLRLISVQEGIINPRKSRAYLHRVLRGLRKVRISNWGKQNLFILPIELRNDFIWLFLEDWSERRRFLIQRCFKHLAMHVLCNFPEIFLSMFFCKCFCLRVLNESAQLIKDPVMVVHCNFFVLIFELIIFDGIFFVVSIV